MTEDDGSELGVSTPAGAVRLRNYRAMDVVLMILAVAVVVGPLFAFHRYQVETAAIHEHYAKLIAKITDRHEEEVRYLTKQMSLLVTVQRFSACLNIFPIDKRAQQLEKGSYCEQVANYGIIPP